MKNSKSTTPAAQTHPGLWAIFPPHGRIHALNFLEQNSFSEITKSSQAIAQRGMSKASQRELGTTCSKDISPTNPQRKLLSRKSLRNENRCRPISQDRPLSATLPR
ncbi:hypothetical protein [Burkholderia stagnalis]